MSKSTVEFREDLVDAFGRLRVSNPATLFDSKQLNDNQPLFWDDQEESGGGTSSTFDGDKASSTLAVTAATAGKRTRQTKMRFNYQSGKSHLIMMTGTLTNQTTDLTDIITQIGYFDENNGIFFSYEEGTLYLIVRSSVTGSPVDAKVAQADWNTDTLSGDGGGNPSQITFDPTKVQIFWFDLEWLGTGTARAGVIIDSKLIICHKFRHANLASNVYMSTPNLPLRASIESTGTDNIGTSMQQICGKVSSEGGVEAYGSIREIDNHVSAVTAATGGTTYALLGIRLNSNYLDSVVEILNVEVLMTSAGAFHWELLINPTIDAGSPSYSQLTNAGVDFFIGDGNITVSGGTNLNGGYGASTGSGGNAAGGAGSAINNSLKIGSLIDGTQDIMVLAVTALADSETFLGSITIRELN